VGEEGTSRGGTQRNAPRGDCHWRLRRLAAFFTTHISRGVRQLVSKLACLQLLAPPAAAMWQMAACAFWKVEANSEQRTGLWYNRWRTKTGAGGTGLGAHRGLHNTRTAGAQVLPGEGGGGGCVLCRRGGQAASLPINPSCCTGRPVLKPAGDAYRKAIGPPLYFFRRVFCSRLFLY
jgi:hypothetical protein